jgi:hypothetical protein
MKLSNVRYLFAAAVLTVAADSALAQTWLKAEIPFTFHAGPSLMDPGTYSVKMPEGSSVYVTLRNLDTGKAVVATYGSPQETGGKAGQPRLMFACAGSRCILQQVWPGGLSRGYNITAPKFARGEAIVAREVVLTHGHSN